MSAMDDALYENELKNISQQFNSKVQAFVNSNYSTLSRQKALLDIDKFLYGIPQDKKIVVALLFSKKNPLENNENFNEFIQI